MDYRGVYRVVHHHHVQLWMKKILLGLFLFATIPTQACPNDVISDGLALNISQKSIDTIIYYEVGGRAYYNARLTRPIVPAWQTTASGVTVGFGMDLGHNTKEQIAKAFKGVASDETIKLLQSVSGLKGRRAYYEGLPKVRHRVSFTYEEAETIFKKDSLPRFTQQTANAFQLSKNRLHPHSNGALTSLVFNRGPSLANTDSRKEMRWIKHNISINKESRVPSDIRSMKRLWDYSKLKGLHLRRDAEAKLFQDGLDTR
jgi:GH24 family phage-related lysozyme (muramidase)